MLCLQCKLGKITQFLLTASVKCWCVPIGNAQSLIPSDKQYISGKYLCIKLYLHRTRTVYGNAFDFLFFKKFSVSGKKIVLGKRLTMQTRYRTKKKIRRLFSCLAPRQVQQCAHLQRLIICSEIL